MAGIEKDSPHPNNSENSKTFDDIPGKSKEVYSTDPSKSFLTLPKPPTYTEHQTLPEDLSPFRLSQGEVKFGISKELKEAVASYTESGEFLEDLSRYPGADLEKKEQELKEVIRERFNISDKPSIFFSGGGSDEILERIVWLLAPSTSNSTNTLILIPPCFPNIINYTDKFKGRDVTNIDIKPAYRSLFMSADDVLKSVLEAKRNYPFKRKENQTIYLCNPTTPAGDIISPETLDSAGELYSQHGNILIIDEAFGDILPDDDSAIKLTDKYPNTIVTRSLSKIAGLAGLRFGYTVMSPNLGEKYASIQRPAYHNDFKINIALAAMKPEIMQPHLEEMREKIFSIKSQLMNELNDANIYYLPTSPLTPIIAIDGERYDFYKNAVELSLEVAAGSAFNQTHPEMTDRFVRLSIPSSVEEIPEIVSRLQQAKNASWL